MHARGVAPTWCMHKGLLQWVLPCVISAVGLLPLFAEWLPSLQRLPLFVFMPMDWGHCLPVGISCSLTVSARQWTARKGFFCVHKAHLIAFSFFSVDGSVISSISLLAIRHQCNWKNGACVHIISALLFVAKILIGNLFSIQLFFSQLQGCPT